MKKYLYVLIFILMVSVVSAIDMYRDVPTESEGNFQVIYTVTGSSGRWGASIVDSVSGGCTFPSGSTDYKSVMLSEDGMTKTITINAPSTDTTCTFSGDYKFADDPAVNFPADTVSITSSQQTTTTVATTTTLTSGNDSSPGMLYVIIAGVALFLYFGFKR